MNKKLKTIIEYILVSIGLIFLCFFINKNLVIKMLFKDDLYHWTWFRGLNIFEFAFKFYPNSTRYRPIFETIQYIIYTIVDCDVFKFSIINKIYNSIVAIFIYHFIKKLNVNKFFAFLFSAFFVISHFNYYQIGQTLGTLETTALFFALIILFYCLKTIHIIENNNNYIKNISILFIMFFLICFTHERYIGLALPITITLLFSTLNNVNNKNLYDNDINYTTTKTPDKLKNKIIIFIVFYIELFVIFFIRFLALHKIIPAGTGGTYVEDTFKIIDFFKFFFSQILIIFGINTKPIYLFGIDFLSIENQMIKNLTILSIFLIFVIIFIYGYIRIKNIKDKKSNFADLIFLSFISICICSSSVTIRVELRFVFISFVVSFIYLTYMSYYIIKNISNNNYSYSKKNIPNINIELNNKTNNKLNKKFLCVIINVIILLIILLRTPIEILYRNNFKNIHCIEDLMRINSIYENTIEKYGLDDTLNNKKIYVIDKYYGMTDFYCEYLFKIYDKNNKGNKIYLLKDITEMDINDLDNENIILFYEDYEKNVYSVFDLSLIKKQY